MISTRAKPVTTGLWGLYLYLEPVNGGHRYQVELSNGRPVRWGWVDGSPETATRVALEGLK